MRATLVRSESEAVEYNDGYADDAVDDGSSWRGKLAGTVPANRSELVAALGGAGWDAARRDVTQAGAGGSAAASTVGLAAVDFDDDGNDGDGPASSSSTSSEEDGFRTDAEMDAFESAGYQIASDEDEATHLKRLTTTWSAWHHEAAWDGGGQQSQQSQQQQRQQQQNRQGRASSGPSSADALQIATLEHRIAQLRADLQDPACTRSIDDMERELGVARGELWRLRGGWGGKIRSALRLQ